MPSQTHSSTLPSLYESLINEVPKKQPIRTMEMAEFDRLSKPEKLRIQEKFFKQESVEKYLDTKWKVELYNRDTFLWLWDILKDEKDEERKNKINNRLKMFQNSIIEQERPCRSIMLDFTKFPFEESKIKKDEEVGGWDD